MREGTPIISTPTVGGLEILGTKALGQFFSLHDEDSLTKAVNAILEDWEANQEML